MELTDYFSSDDGSLPEIEVRFLSGDGVAEGLTYLFALGARDASVGDTCIWMRDSNENRPFEGPNDANLVIAGTAEAFHLVLTNIDCTDSPIPELGVFVLPDQLVLDYRMGPEWGPNEIHALLVVLSRLRDLGGHVSATSWWGADGNQTLSVALDQLS
ncbi:hypothetical protein J2W27_004659 [Variovorax boronicumulans]|uniref:hypothetical protein n=1 Tax=Variovorax boronicumulans TaxID=436515 RepID=UPI00278AD217|nr:hypothetical protein [Variovorax boronicumulans]MDP9912533.1 hypothetical protein [Variovorax boronicumulans]